MTHFPRSPYEEILNQLKRMHPLQGIYETSMKSQLQRDIEALGRSPFHDILKSFDAFEREEKTRKMLAIARGEDQARKTLEAVHDQLRHADLFEKLQRELSGRDAFIDAATKALQQHRLSMTGPMYEALRLQQQWESAGGMPEALRKYIEPATWGALHPLHEAFKYVDLFEEAESADEEDKAEARKAVDAIAREVAEEATPQSAIKRILRLILAAAGKPTLQALLLFGLFHLLSTLTTAVIEPIADHYVKQHLGESRQASARNIESRALQAVDGNRALLEGYRYVSVDVVNVRTNPKLGSEPVGKLRLGQAVRILKKEKDWVLVVWTKGDDTAAIQGWVSTRYLSTFN